MHHSYFVKARRRARADLTLEHTMDRTRTRPATINTPRVQTVINDLYEEVIRTDPAERQNARAKGLGDDGDSGFYDAMAKAFMPVTPEFGKLLYVTACASRASQIIEFGTSFGISTIFLAAAIRDNGGGCLITTEYIQPKVERARQHLAAAGFDDIVDLRVGDARDSLAGKLPETVDLLLLDGPKVLYLDILRLVEPHLRLGAVVASDNTDMAGAESYRKYVREPENGYLAATFSTSALNSSCDHEVVLRCGGRRESS